MYIFKVHIYIFCGTSVPGYSIITSLVSSRTFVLISCLTFLFRNTLVTEMKEKKVKIRKNL